MVGTNEYLAKTTMLMKPMRLSLQAIYPNPCRSNLHVRYTLPYEGIERVRFSIYDMRGQRVWQTEERSVTRFGLNELVWNGRSSNDRRLAPGVYLLRMTAFAPTGVSVGAFDQRLTFIP
jgi:hypothetical protein